MPQGRLRRLFLVAGGTGGHICPAVGFGQWLISREKDLEITYVSGSRPLEREIYRHAGLDAVILPCEGSPMGKRGWSSCLRWIQVAGGTIEMGRLFGRRRPDACVLFGGYVSFPALVAGWARKVPLVVHEQNTVAGRVTRLGVRMGARLLTGWKECSPFRDANFSQVGTPVRFMRRLPRREAWNKLGLGEFPAGKTICLVLGGSLGSRSLADRIFEISQRENFDEWMFLVMGAETGDNHLSERVWGIPRRWDMETIYSLSDVAVVRGGASTLSELRAWAIPALVVPWPESRDDHQSANAKLFAEDGYGVVWDEVRENAAELLAKLLQLGQRRVVERGYSTDPGVAAEQINQKFLGEILRTLEGREGSWTDLN